MNEWIFKKDRTIVSSVGVKESPTYADKYVIGGVKEWTDLVAAALIREYGITGEEWLFANAT